jgi:hypothetical protein
MSSKKIWVVELVTQIVGDKPTAEMVVERLMEEGLLVLGYGDADIDKVVEQFKLTFGTTKVSKYDRFAAGRLVKKYNSQAIVGIIGLLGQHRDEKYAPVVGSITQLEDKIVSVLHFLRNLDKDEDTTIQV